MTELAYGKRDRQGNWRPTEPVRLPPIHARPFKVGACVKWLFGFPGFLWPQNAFWFGITLVTWFFLTPPLAVMATLEPWWVGLILARNAGILLLLFGGLHLYLYVVKGQGDDLKYTTKPLSTGSRQFLFRNQVWDNVFRSLVFATPVITLFEAATYWLFANGFLGLFEIASPIGFWIWFGLLVLLVPAIHAFHFYWGHRLLHVPVLYRAVHGVHHRNVEVGPWSGLAMHPAEHVIYFSTIVVQWLLALHPINALFQLQVAIFYAAMAHTGFEKIMFGKRMPIDNNSYFHYLHHQYFECNYGGGLVPFDWLFGTAHDGTPEAHAVMTNRLREGRAG